MNTRRAQKKERQKRIRARLTGTKIRPRLSVFRSNQRLSVSLHNDDEGITLMTLVSKSGKNRDAAKELGIHVASYLEKKNIKTVVFDRSGYAYHGKIKSLVDSVREKGITV